MEYAMVRASVRNVAVVVGVLAIAFLSVFAILSRTAHAATGLGSVQVTEVVSGGSANPSDFTITIKKIGSVNAGTLSASGENITFTSLTPGMYMLTQTGGPSGYTASWSSNCASGRVTVVADATVSCTITNTLGFVRGGGTGGGGGGGGGGSTGGTTVSGRPERPTITRPTR